MSTDKENAELRLRLARMEGIIKSMTAETTPQERDELASAQSRADSVAAMYGDRAPAPIPGEKPVDYRKRLLAKFQRHSPAYNGVKFDAFDPATLGLVEERVYADAMTTARTSNDAQPGILIPVTKRDQAGREITTFHGDVGAFLAPFQPTHGQVVRLRDRGVN